MKFLIKYSRKTVIKQIYLKKPPKRSFEGGPEEPENPKKRALDNIDRLVSYDIADPDLLGFLKACQKGIKRYPLFMQNSEYFKYTEKTWPTKLLVIREFTKNKPFHFLSGFLNVDRYLNLNLPLIF